METKYSTRIIGLFILFVFSTDVLAWNQPPVAVLTVSPTQALINQDILFDSSGSYDPDGSIVERAWNFGEGSGYQVINQVTVTHQYSQPGTYTARLRIKDNQGVYVYSSTCTVYVYEDKTLRVDENTTCTTGCDGSTWELAFKYLQDALDAAQPTNKIWVAEGTYYPDQNSIYPGGSGLREETFRLSNYVGIYGGFPSGLTGEGNLDDRDPKTYETILSGDVDGDGLLDNDNSYHVVTADDPSIGNSAILDGFTITGGRADGDWQLGYNDGAGIYCYWGSPTISNCIISGNVAIYLGYGGGMCNYCNNAKVIDCTFSDNSAGNAGAGMINYDSEPTLTNCTFSRNSTDGYAGGMFNWSSNPTLINCVFTGNSTTSDAGGGVLNYDSEPTLTNCVFSGNSTAHHGGGMYIYDKSPKLVNCTFSGNSANHKGGGIYNYEGNPELTNCIFWGNTDEYSELKKDEQIYVYSGTPSVTYSCIQDDNPGDGDIPFGGAGNKNIDDNPHFVNANNPNGPDGILATLDDGLRVSKNSLCIDSGDNDAISLSTDIAGYTRKVDVPDNLRPDTGNGEKPIVDMGAYESQMVWFVDDDGDGTDGKSWDTAFTNLQDALAVSSAGDEVWVAQGIYKPDRGGGITPGDKTATFQLINGVAMKGGYAGSGASDSYAWDTNTYKTILSGDLAGNDDDPSGGKSENSYQVVTGSGTDQTAVLDGFTITAGNTSYSLPNKNFGGGMYNFSGSPTVSNCIFSGNFATASGGLGGGMYNENSSPTVTNCIFSGNLAAVLGGGMYNENSSPTVTNCIFRDNFAHAWGGGMYNEDSSLTVTGCFFEKNKANFGGGMLNNCSSPTVVNCVFSGNYSGEAGGGMYNYYKPTAKLVNCVFSGNCANNAGGGMSNYISPLTLVNCTFSGNSATNKGGAIENDISDQKLTNCVIWGNYAPTDPEITNNFSHPRVKCCDIRGCGGSGEGWHPSFGYDNGGNIDDDPNFVDVNNPTGPDGAFGTLDDGLRLRTDSPCIDKGSNIDIEATGVTTDIIGHARIADGDHVDDAKVDMGAYELPRIWFVDTNATDGNDDGSSWDDAFIHLQNALAVADDGDEIWVAEGTYKPDRNSANPGGSGLREVTFQLKAGVGIYGGFAGTELSRNERNWQAQPTILSGDIDIGGDQDSYHVVTGSGTDETAVLDGFTITGGNANGGDSDDFGGGMYNYHGSPMVTNCTFTGNTAFSGGGGMYNKESSSPALTDCTFSSNLADFAGGMYNSSGSSPFLTNCTFSENTAVGPSYGDAGAMANQSSSPTLTNCTFSNNTASGCNGGGMANQICPAGYPKLTNCIFSGNQSATNGGGMHNYKSSPTLTNCIFSGNEAVAYYGGGMDNYSFSNPTLSNCVFCGNLAGYSGGGMENHSYCSPTLTNCTFSSNSASSNYGGGIRNYQYSNPKLTNCILWGNTDYSGTGESAQIYGGTPDVTYSCVQDADPNDGDIYPGTGNIDDNPCFEDPCDPNGSDNIFVTFDDGLRLQIDSPCIDAADGNAAPSTDILGFPRLDSPDVNNTGTGEPNYVDMGAYEYKALLTLYAGGSKKSDGTGVLVYERLPSDTSWHAISDEGDFGAADAILSLCYHDCNIYAGTKAASGEAAVYRWDGGTDWTKVSDDNWGNDYVTYVLSLIEYKGDLYAGTKPVNLYRYDREDDWTPVDSNLSNWWYWDGIKCLYEWDGVLYLGDSYYDKIAHYAPPTISTLTQIYPDSGQYGSCIWDFQLYYDRLYASAYQGVIYRSEEDDGSDWEEWTDLGSDNVWELEEYQDKLFIAAGYKLYYYEAEDESPGASIWEIPSADRQYGEEIISMLSTGDYLYIGTGDEFSWGSPNYSAIGNVYVYYGLNSEKMSDGLDTSGIQCLLEVP